MYSGIYLKKCSHTNFNFYVVGTELETKDLHLELSLQICSRACHTVKSPKKEQDDGLQANWYYEIISWKPVHLKNPIGFKYPNLLIRPIRCMGFYHAKQQQPDIWELIIWLGQITCQMSPNPKTNQKPTTVPPHISVNNGQITTFQQPSTAFQAGKKHQVFFPPPRNKTLHILICSLNLAFHSIWWPSSQSLPFIGMYYSCSPF